MEITSKGRMLRIHGKDLAKRTAEAAQERYDQEISEEKLTDSDLLKEEFEKRSGYLDNFKPKDRKKIMGYFAEGLMEMNMIRYAYQFYSQIGSKKAKTIEKTFPRFMWEDD